jgi:penicillin-binding protein 1A
LGAAEVTALDLTSAYAVLANGGAGAEPYAALEIRNARGEIVYVRDRGQGREILPAAIAGSMNAMLARVPEVGTGRRAALRGLRSAGKTGTSNAYRDAWYVGFTGRFVGGIWFGNDDNRPTRGMTGGTLPAAAWREVMTFAHRGLPEVPIPGLGDAPALTASAPATSAGGFAIVTGPPGFASPARTPAGFKVISLGSD